MPTTSNFGWTTPADTDLVKDGAAAIRTLGNGIDTSLVDLKGGTTGQILSKASNTDLDYTWIANDQGDITEVQAGVGISIASGTGPVPVITNSSTDLITTAGDLLYGTAADTVARLGIGTAGQVLKVNSGATAPEWAAASTAFKGVFLRQSAGQTIANATDTTLLFDTEIFDTDGFHSTVTNTGRITIPAGLGGYYLFIIHTSFTANATGYREAYLNTSVGPFYIDAFASTVGSGSRATLSASVILNLSATDYVESICKQTSSGNLDTISGTGGTTLSAVYLGA